MDCNFNMRDSSSGGGGSKKAVHVKVRWISSAFEIVRRGRERVELTAKALHWSSCQKTGIGTVISALDGILRVLMEGIATLFFYIVSLHPSIPSSITNLLCIIILSSNLFLQFILPNLPCILLVPIPQQPIPQQQWAGKTIALGTFPSAEADEKCARAKALTRAWRSTMRPKPSREWVMLELERLQVRIVSGRLGRKEDDDEEEGDDGSDGDGESAGAGMNNNPGGMGMMGIMGGMGMNNNNANQHRPMVGGGSAAAYEAARADHYAKSGGNNNMNNLGGMKTGGSSMSGGMNPMTALSNNNSMMPSGNMSNLGLSVNPNQHYEM
eukprot:scaffold1698_cov201-Alexandrium_tamarense.AAC.20